MNKWMDGWLSGIPIRMRMVRMVDGWKTNLNYTNLHGESVFYMCSRLHMGPGSTYTTQYSAAIDNTYVLKNVYFMYIFTFPWLQTKKKHISKIH